LGTVALLSSSLHKILSRLEVVSYGAGGCQLWCWTMSVMVLDDALCCDLSQHLIYRYAGVTLSGGCGDTHKRSWGQSEWELCSQAHTHELQQQL